MNNERHFEEGLFLIAKLPQNTILSQRVVRELLKTADATRRELTLNEIAGCLAIDWVGLPDENR